MNTHTDKMYPPIKTIRQDNFERANNAGIGVKFSNSNSNCIVLGEAFSDVELKFNQDLIPLSGRQMDFLSDQLFVGSKLRVLAIVDAFSRLSPAIDVRQRYRGADVAESRP